MPTADRPDKNDLQRAITALALDDAKPKGKRPSTSDLLLYCERKLENARHEEVKSWIAREPQIFEAFCRLAENVEVTEAASASETSISDPDPAPTTSPWWRTPGWLAGGLAGTFATALLVALLLPKLPHQDDSLQTIQLALNESYQLAETSGIQWQTAQQPYKEKSLDDLLGMAEPKKTDKDRQSFQAGIRFALAQHQESLQAEEQQLINKLPSERKTCKEKNCDQREALLFELGRWSVLTHSICISADPIMKQQKTVAIFNDIISQLDKVEAPDWLKLAREPINTQPQACLTATKLVP